MTKFKRNIIIILINILIVLLIYSLIYFRISWGNHIFTKDYLVGSNCVTYFKNGTFTFKNCKLVVYGKLIIDNSVVLTEGKSAFIVIENGEVCINKSKIKSFFLSNNAKAFLKNSSVYLIGAYRNAYIELDGGRYDEININNIRRLTFKNCRINSISDIAITKPYKPKTGFDDVWSYNFYRIEDFTKLGSRNYSNWGGIYDFIESDNGLSLPVGAKGSLVYRFEKDKPLESLFMKLWFSAEENSITVSWENGRKIETIIRNKCYKGESIDLTKYLKNSKFILLNFSAENKGIEQEVVLEKIIFYGQY